MPPKMYEVAQGEHGEHKMVLKTAETEAPGLPSQKASTARSHSFGFAPVAVDSACAVVEEPPRAHAHGFAPVEKVAPGTPAPTVRSELSAASPTRLPPRSGLSRSSVSLRELLGKSSFGSIATTQTAIATLLHAEWCIVCDNRGTRTEAHEETVGKLIKRLEAASLLVMHYARTEKGKPNGEYVINVTAHAADLLRAADTMSRTGRNR